MDGVLILDKPRGISSAQALYRVRKVLGQRKSGHAGTLDPAADGVLIICLGRATKLVEAMMDLPKIYRATARLDVTSSSFDSDRPLIDVPIAMPPTETTVREVLSRFEGETEQVPPAVSALKVGGRPAYELERKGKTVTLAPRRVQIYWMHLHHYCWPELDFEMACGRGTYVRSVIRDFGIALHTGGCLTALARLAIGPFRQQEAISIAALENLERPDERVISMERVREWLAVRPPELPSRPG